MSETTTSLAPEPAPAPAPAPTPEPVEQAEGEQTEEQRQHPADKRFAVLTAKLSAAERIQAEQRSELEFLRAQRQPAAPVADTPEAREQQMRQQIRAEEGVRLRAERFHQEGAAEFSDWSKKCADLMAMGVDKEFASLLLEMPNAPRVVAALADDPEEVQRIAGIYSERGRAIALGAYAAKLNNGAAAAPAPVTRAPAPVRPVSGRASPTFNEYTASAQDLVDHYLKPAKR
jgi:hypothetical protein